MHALRQRLHHRAAGSRQQRVVHVRLVRLSSGMYSYICVYVRMYMFSHIGCLYMYRFKCVTYCLMGALTLIHVPKIAAQIRQLHVHSMHIVVLHHQPYICTYMYIHVSYMQARYLQPTASRVSLWTPATPRSACPANAAPTVHLCGRSAVRPAPALTSQPSAKAQTRWMTVSVSSRKSNARFLSSTGFSNTHYIHVAYACNH